MRPVSHQTKEVGMIFYENKLLDPTSSQHGSEDYPTSPDIRRLRSVFYLAEELWSYIRKSPTQSTQETLSSFETKHGGQTEICQLQVI